jgi:hypothetical protein
LPTGESIPVHLQQGIDSGRLKNGQNVAATLDSAVRTRSGTTLPAGTPVSLTVIETVPAGKLSAVGEFSLELVRVGSVPVFTDTQTFRGQPGHRDLPDSAPALGTDAGLPQGARLTFHVQPAPGFGVKSGSDAGSSPGSVNGVASGQPPPKGAETGQTGAGGSNGPGANGRPGSGNQPGQVKPVQPANNTPEPAQNLGQPSVAPNQPAKPSPSPTNTQPQ